MTKIRKKLLPVLLAICLSMSIAPISALAEGADAVCKIGETEYTDLDLALDTIGEGESKTIELLSDIDYDKGMVIENKSVEFDLNGNDLNIDNESDIGLKVTQGGTVGYTGGGEFNVTGTLAGVVVEDINSAVTVTNAEGTTNYGVNASAGKIIVKGSVIGTKIGAQAANGGEVVIKGDVRALNADGIGAWATGTGAGGCSKITIDGMIDAKNYIKVGDEVKNIGDAESDDTKPGYLKYGSESTGIVWVLNTVCAIGEDGYATLDEALADVPEWENGHEPTTIWLLKNIAYEQSIELENKRIDFNLNGFTLNVYSKDDTSPALSVINGGISLSGEGEFNVSGHNGIYAEAEATPLSVVTVTSANATAVGGYAAQAHGNASIIVLEDVIAVSGDGAIASNGASINIGGEVIAGRTGVEAGEDAETTNGANIYVKSNISACQVGAKVLLGGAVTIDGEITDAPTYIMVGDTTKIKRDGVLDTGPNKLGYLKYSSEDLDASVWVKATTYALTINGGGSGATSTGDYIEGEIVNINAGTRNGYTFTGWTSSDVAITNASNKTASFIMLAKNVTVTANWSYNGGRGSGGSSHNNDPIVDTPLAPENPNDGVDSKQDAPDFTDISTHWAKSDIEFVASRGLFNGTSATTFSPNATMTRGMFVTVLGRLANADVSDYKRSGFTDVKDDAYYIGYIEWASKNSITNGTGNGKFAPDQPITREEMAVIMSNYAEVIGLTLPKIHEESTFEDGAKISAYAKDAVNQMQMAGVISGKSGNLLDPQGIATRAEISAVLHRFVELANVEV